MPALGCTPQREQYYPPAEPGRPSVSSRTTRPSKVLAPKPWSLVDYTAVLDGVYSLWDDTVCESLLAGGGIQQQPLLQRSTNRFCRFVTALTTTRVASATKRCQHC